MRTLCQRRVFSIVRRARARAPDQLLSAEGEPALVVALISAGTVVLASSGKPAKSVI
jgi:hypothetical protein